MRAVLALLGGLFLLVSSPAPAFAQADEPSPTLPPVTVPLQQQAPLPSATPAPSSEETPPATDPTQISTPSPPPPPSPEQVQPQPVQQPVQAVDPAAGFTVDPATGYLIEPQTGLLIEPGTGTLIDPTTYFYTTFRFNFATGEVVEAEPATKEPPRGPSEQPQPEESPVATPLSVALSPSPPSSASVSDSPSGRAVDGNATAGDGGVPLGEHPITRALVVLLLIGLGAVYQAKLRGGSRS